MSDDRILTPMEELLAQNAALYRARRDEVSVEGAFQCLIHVSDPNMFSQAVCREAARGVGYSDLMNAAGAVIAHHIVTTAAAMRDPSMALGHLATIINFRVGEMLSGRDQMALVRQSLDGVTQEEVTVEGLFREGGHE